MSLFKAFVAFALLCASVATLPAATAKDLSGRLGVGFINEFSNSTPAISAKYGLSKDLHWLGAVGFKTNSPSTFTLGTKIFKNIFYENNLNFYGTLGFAVLKDARSGVEFLGAFGAEYFIPGIDSLGLSFEAGVAATNISGSFALKTIGFTFLHAGTHFYF